MKLFGSCILDCDHFFTMQTTVFAAGNIIFDLNIPGLIDIVTSLEVVKKITKTKKTDSGGDIANL